MLQILGEVWPNLQLLDLWKSARVTDQGLRSLLGILHTQAEDWPGETLCSNENLKCAFFYYIYFNNNKDLLL
jgi:hypothetical protein